MAEILYYNGEILTLEEEMYVQALLVKDKKIAKLGSKDELLKVASKDVTMVDLEGKTLMPSFMDAHSHFSGYASSLTQVSLAEVINFKEMEEAITRFIEKNKVPEGKWIQGDGYDQNSLEEKKHPTIAMLDKVAPKNPLIVKHKSGHMGVMNTLALKELGITVDTPPIEGGVIEVKDGKLTGYVEEAAFMHYMQKIPMGSNEEFFASLMQAQHNYASFGITTVQEGFVVEQLAPVFQFLSQSNMLKIDIIGYMNIDAAEALKKAFSNCLNTYDNHIKMGGYKTFLDGSPQGRTAWVRQAYEGEEVNYFAYGTQKDEELERKLELALTDNMQMLVHCNGDAACEQYITQFGVALEKTKSKNKIRPVIVHAQLLDYDQLDRVKQQEMIPSFFVAHVYHWGDVHIKNFGKERAQRISMAKSALDKGILFTFHQDSPVIEPNMLETIWCAVNRVTKNGVVLGERERISPLEALKAVTKNVAYQYFEEESKGTLKEGKLADLVILDKNILKVEPMDIKNIQVLETIKEGQTIFEKK